MSMYQYNFFEHYIDKLDKVLSKFHVPLNFVSIGTCDGQAEDKMITSFMKNSNWNGLFVEPMSLNHRDFRSLIEANNATDRAFLLHAAANETCTNTTIKFTRPNAEEKEGANSAHWIRRQIGHIYTPQDAKVRDPNRIIEDVRCMTFPDILKAWSSNLNEKSPNNPHQIIRPHAVKVDTEGNDYFILRSLLKSFHVMFASRMLPFIILWECKVIGEALYMDLKSLLSRKNYAVSGYGNDCFAMLKQKVKNKEKIDRNKDKGDKKNKNGGLFGGLLG